MGAVVVALAPLVGITLGSATAAVVSAVVNVALAAASIASSVKQAKDQKKAAKRAQMESQQRNSYRNFRQPLTPRRIIYGRCRVAGPLLFAANRSTDEAHLVIGIAGHEIDAFEKFYMLKDELPVDLTPGSTYGRVADKYAANIILWPFEGTSSQDIGAKMRTATDVRPGGSGSIALDYITTSDRFRGIAALYVVTKKFGVSWEGQNPDFAALVRGRRVFDPRTNTTAWSANPALCIADYLVNYMGFPAETIDEDSWIAAANICDQSVALAAGGTEKRYEANGVLGAENTHQENLELLADAMAGAVRYSSGRWIIEAGAPKATSMPIDESMVLGDYEVEMDKPDRSLPNAVRGNFVDPVEWQPMSYPVRTVAEAVAAEGGENWLEVDLPLTTSPSMAQRIAKISLGRARSRRSMALEIDLSGMLVRPGNVIAYSAPELGFNNELFEVDGWSLSRSDGDLGPTLSVRLDLVEYDPAIYNWTAGTDEAAIVRGEVSLDAVRSKFFTNPQVVESGVSTSGSMFQATYSFTAGVPRVAGKTIAWLKISVELAITTTDGETNQTLTHVRSGDVGTGGGALTVAILYPKDIAGGTPATGTLTVASQPTAGDTITIGPRVLTWVVGTPGPDQIALDTTSPEAIRYLGSAQNLVDLLDTDPLVSGSRAGGVVALTARAGGSGTHIGLATTGTAVTRSGPNLTGGSAANKATGTITFVDTPADGDMLTIGAMSLTWIDTGPAGPGEMVINTSYDETIRHAMHAQLAKLFFNGGQEAELSGDWNVLTASALSPGTGGNSIALSATGAAMIVSGSTLTGGDGGSSAPHAYVSHTIVAATIQCVYTDGSTSVVENALVTA